MSLDPKRIAQIAQDMFTVVNSVSSYLDARDDMKAQAQAAGEAVTSERERIMGAVASASIAGNWTEAETKAAAKAAGQMHNDKAKASAIATVCNDCRLAAHPAVRSRFSELSGIANEAWNVEAEQRKLDSDYPSPVAKLFKRRYHTVIAAFKLAIEGVNDITCAEDLVDYAKANDPDWDAGKMLKQIQKMVGDLSDLVGNFPMQAIHDAREALANVDEADLKYARANKLAGKPITSTPAPAPRAKPAKASTTVAVAPAHPFKASPAPAAPLSDDIDNILGDGTEGVEVELAEAA